ncbi:MAG: hypothetical protein RMJ98_17035 [Myxococcales bacterium]|nr:hypothetical protein [Polyangiaceae bacterium]MDW8251001.1 hypothetical protein [Myxococcales bacterium]
MLVGCAPSDQGMVGSKMEAGGQGVACRPQEGQVCVDRVGGTVVDLQGNALAGKVVTVCGIMCFAGTTDEDGTFSVQVGAPLRSGEYALSVYGRPDHGSLYLQLPVLTREVFLSSAVELPALPPGGPVLPPDGTPASSITSGPLTLSFANGTAFELDIDDMVRGEEGRRLRVAVVAPAKATFVSHAVWLLALAPFGARLSIPAAVEIVGTQGLSEGQRVEFWFLEDDLLAQGGNRAGLGAVAAEGRVEGGKIRSDPGQGLTKLTWLAVRPK